MQRVRVGYSTDPDTQMGPIATKRQLERVKQYIEGGKADGADLICGGSSPAHPNLGYFIEPTLFGNVDNESTIAQEGILARY